MSYRYRVIADNPIGYWDLSKSGTSSVNPDLYSNNNASVSTNVIFCQPPLVVNSGSSLKINATSASVQIKNNYDIFTSGTTAKTFSMEMWFSFNNLFNGNGYDLNNGANGYFNNNKLNIIRAVNTTTGSTVATLYYDYNSNSFRYNVGGGNNLDANYYVKSFDSPFHIVAIYKRGSYSIYINGKKGIDAVISDGSVLSSASSKNQITFVIDGSSLNTNYLSSSVSGSPTFSISDLAFYNYELAENKIVSHISWASLDDFPNSTSNFNQNLDFFNFKSTNDDFVYYEKISGFDFSKVQSTYNMRFDKNGMSIKRIADLIYNDYTNTPADFNSSSGVGWSSSFNNISFPNFGENIINNFTISLKVSSSATASSLYIYTISGINDNNYVYLLKNPTASPWGYYFYYYDTYNDVSTLLSSVTSVATASIASIDYITTSFDNQNIYMYVGSSASAANPISIANSTFSKLSVANNAVLSIGGPEIDQSKFYNVNGSYFSNLSLYNFAATNYSAASAGIFNNYLYYSTMLNGDLVTQQYGYFIHEYNPTVQSDQAYGTFIKWDGPDNARVQVSYDNGSIWYSVYNNQYITGYNHTVVPEKVLFKFETYQKYSSSAENLKFDNIFIGSYYNKVILSDMKNFNMSFKTNSSSVYNTFSIRNAESKIIFRPENFGITFKTNTSGSIVNGYSTISSTFASAYGIDMWVRIDGNPPSSPSNIYLLTSSSYSLWYTASNPVLQFSPTSQMFVYINGASVANSSYKIVPNEYLHLAVSHSFPVSGDININGGTTNSGSLNANATYGYITLWNTASPIPTDVSLRYNTYIGNYTQVASANDSALFLRQTSYYDAASAYYLG